MAKYAEAKRTAEKLRAQAADMLVFADWIEENGVKLGKHDLPYFSETRTFTTYLTETNFVAGEDGAPGTWPMDEARTKTAMKRFLGAVGSCEKEYTDNYLKIRKTFGEGKVVLEGTVEREIACTKKVVEKKWIEPQTIEGRYEEVVEWDCTTPSLLRIVND